LLIFIHIKRKPSVLEGNRLYGHRESSFLQEKSMAASRRFMSLGRSSDSAATPGAYYEDRLDADVASPKWQN
jgi:hypothetical protein